MSYGEVFWIGVQATLTTIGAGTFLGAVGGSIIGAVRIARGRRRRAEEAERWEKAHR